MKRHKLTKKEIDKLLKEDPCFDRIKDAFDGKCNIYEYYGLCNLIRTSEKKKLVDRLRKVYDNNKLSEKDEITILDTIEFLGGKINW